VRGYRFQVGVQFDSEEGLGDDVNEGRQHLTKEQQRNGGTGRMRMDLANSLVDMPGKMLWILGYLESYPTQLIS
jgi:hypothetical protein